MTEVCYSAAPRPGDWLSPDGTDCGRDRLADFDRLGGPAQVLRSWPVLGDVAERVHDEAGGFLLAQVVEHQRARPDRGHRVRDALARASRGRAVDRLEHRGVLALGIEVRRSGQPQRTLERASQVSQDVTEEV